jgi:flagellar hook-associated protein 3 FlgL
MIQYSDPMGEGFLANLASLQRRLTRVSTQVSSGVRVSRPSDAPEDVVDIVRLRSEIAQAKQTTKNLNQVKTQAEAADNALQSAIQLVEKAITDASQAAGTTGEPRRPTLATAVEAIQQQLVDISRTSDQGQYIFSGDHDETPVYQYDSTATNGVVQLQNPTATRLAMGPGGGTFAVSKTAQEIFDARNADGAEATGNMFAAVNDLRVALEKNDSAGIDSALTKLRQADAHLNQQAAFYGTVEDRITTQLSLADKYNTRWTTELGEKRDTDTVSAAVELTQLETQQSAAYSAQSNVSHTSLFDYLK